VIEAKLARNRQSEHSSTVTKTQADCVKEQSSASQKSSAQLNRSLPPSSSTNCSATTSSVSTTKSQVVDKPGANTCLIIET